jgi:uncharacterized protein
VTKQGLSGGRRRTPTTDDILSVGRDLCYVQWDPVSVVAPAHMLTLWSRLGKFRESDLERLLHVERRLFRYCAHADSIVLTEDYPLYRSLMSRYPESLSSGWGSWRAHARVWIPRHRELRRRVLKELEGGPLSPGGFKDHRSTRRAAGAWGSGSDVSAMLFHLWMAGEVMLVGKEGGKNLWGLTRKFLPDWAAKTKLSVEEVERVSAERAIRAMGLASRAEIHFYFVRGMYQDLPAALEGLERSGRIRRIEIDGQKSREPYFVHTDDLPLLDTLEAGEWESRLSLLSPFDNMICWRGRTRTLFDFDYYLEMYVPEAKRRFGYYVLPILWGDRFIGRIDPKFDRETSTLEIKAVHAEKGAPGDAEVGSLIAERVSELADFVGAKNERYSRKIPGPWKRALR